MSEISVSQLKPIGEFGSKAWCEACAQYGVQLLEEGNLPADLAWGFSEIYTHPPARLLSDGRELSAYFIMVKNGSITGGDGVPEECLGLPGFHVKIQWGAICNQSASLYGREGQRQRSADEKVLFEEIAQYVGKKNPLGLERRPPAFWPPEVSSALSKGSEQGGGLHNIAASLQKPSPEFEGVPVTKLGVPIFRDMSDSQKQSFLSLLNVRPD